MTRFVDIGNDRQLLEALGMSDSQAAMYLGKSRQAFNNQLGPRRPRSDFPVPNDYFKLSEILVLVIAALHGDHNFDRRAIQSYVDQTRRPKPDEPDAPYELLKSMLSGSKQIDFADAAVIILILPAFADMRSSVPDLSGELEATLDSIKKMSPTPSIVVLSSNRMRAEMAANTLRIPDAHKAWHDFVDHYVPTLLVYDHGKRVPRPFVLTHQGGLVAAPQFRASAMSECVHFMAPEAWNRVFPMASSSREPLEV